MENEEQVTRPGMLPEASKHLMKAMLDADELARDPGTLAVLKALPRTPGDGFEQIAEALGMP